MQGGRYELALAQLGSRLATKPAIRRFAQMVVRDHAAANAALMRLVKAEGVRAPAGMTAEDAAMLTRMKTLRGTNFDRAFVDEMNRINIEDAQAAGKETATTSDRSIKAYLARFAVMDARHKRAAAALRKGGLRHRRGQGRASGGRAVAHLTLTRNTTVKLGRPAAVAAARVPAGDTRSPRTAGSAGPLGL